MLIPDEEIPAWERGSKLAHASWTIYICELFAFKGVLLTLFCKIS
jgi:hypothetical protein